MPKSVQPSSGNRCRKFYEDMRCADSLAPVDSAEDPLRRPERSFPPSTSSLIEGLASEIPLPPMTSPNNLPPLGREHAPDQEAPATSSMEENRKLVVKIPDPLLTTLRATCAAKVDVSLLGKLQGNHPGLKALTAWARDTLHPSLSLLSLKTNNLFEVTFTHPEGRIHALTQADLICDTAVIFFSSWKPHFDSKAPQQW